MGKVLLFKFEDFVSQQLNVRLDRRNISKIVLETTKYLDCVRMGNVNDGSRPVVAEQMELSPHEVNVAGKKIDLKAIYLESREDKFLIYFLGKKKNVSMGIEIRSMDEDFCYDDLGENIMNLLLYWYDGADIQIEDYGLLRRTNFN